MAITQFRRPADGLIATVVYRDETDEATVTIGSEAGQRLYEDVPQFAEFDNPAAMASEVFATFDEIRGGLPAPWGSPALELHELPRLRLVA